MQPDREKSDWQQPTEQPSQAPYVAQTQDTQTKTPVVTLTSDSPHNERQMGQAEVVGDPMVMSQPDDDSSVQSPAPVQSNEEEPVHWQASEYIHHDKNPSWFVLFALIVLLLMAVSIFLIQSITFTILIPVMAAALLVYSHRPPRILDYTLSRKGLHINDHLYSFAEFKGFGVIRDGEEYSVMLLPVKRFKLGVTVYFPEEAGEAIVDILGTRLPMQELHLDLFDKIIRKLRI